MDTGIAEKNTIDSIRYFKMKQSNNETQIFAEQLRQALNDHSLVSIADVKGNIIYANAKFCEVSGYSLAELMGANHRILKSDVHDEGFFKHIWKTIASGQTWHGEICNKAKDGQPYWVQSTIVPFLNKATGKPEQYVSIRTEITQQKELQEKMDQLFLEAMAANEAKSSFLTNISHELRTPLNHIIGFSEILEMSTSDTDLLENVEYIKEAGHDLLDKISNVLELVGKNNRAQKPREMINIVKLVNTEFIDNFKTLAQKSKRKFTKAVPDHDIYIVADSMDLITAFRKIAENAIQFSTEEDIVGMSISADDETVTIAIFDTGPGLPEHILSSSLEPFTIGEKVTTKTNCGMGLGLPIAKKLCLQNGGKIELEADKDIGTKIHFHFPIALSDCQLSTNSRYDGEKVCCSSV